MPTNKVIIETLDESFAKRDVPTVLAAKDPKIVWTEAEGWRSSESVGTFHYQEKLRQAIPTSQQGSCARSGALKQTRAASRESQEGRMVPSRR